MPKAPEIVYRDKGWISWYHFFGREKVPFLPYAKARNFVKKLNLNSQTQWKNIVKMN